MPWHQIQTFQSHQKKNMAMQCSRLTFVGGATVSASEAPVRAVPPLPPCSFVGDKTSAPRIACLWNFLVTACQTPHGRRGRGQGRPPSPRPVVAAAVDGEGGGNGGEGGGTAPVAAGAGDVGNGDVAGGEGDAGASRCPRPPCGPRPPPCGPRPLQPTRPARPLQPPRGRLLRQPRSAPRRPRTPLCGPRPLRPALLSRGP